MIIRLNARLTAAFLLLLLCCLAWPVTVCGSEYGLYFKSHKFSQDERTSLCLTPRETLNCGRGFVLEFDIQNRFEMSAYGYVFRLVADDSICLDMVSNIGWKRVDLVLSKDHVLIEKTTLTDPGNFFSGQWSHIRLEVGADRLISLTIDGQNFRMGKEYPSKGSNLRIYFGAVKHPLFGTSDVSPFTLKDVTFRASGHRLYHWRLGSHLGDTVYDELHRAEALAINPQWLVDEHYNWSNLFSARLKSPNPQVAIDSGNDRVILALKDSVVLYNVATQMSESFPAMANHPICECASQMYYDGEKDRLCCFSMNGCGLSRFDMSSRKWDLTLVEPWPQKSGFTSIVDIEKREQYIFGGYANHNYCSLFTTTNIDTGESETVNLSGLISPRYFSSVTALGGERFFVAGGYGSTTGSQADVPFYSYDTFFYNHADGAVEAGPALALPQQHPVVFAGQGVLDRDDPDCILALSFDSSRYRTQLQLVRISMRDGQVEELSSPINYDFLDVSASAALAYSSDSTRLIVYALNAERDSETRLDIYTLAYPPVSFVQTVQQVDDDADLRNIVILVVLCVIVLLTAILALVQYLRRQHTDKMLDVLLEQSSQRPRSDRYDISLLGGLRLFNADGVEITGKFQPMLRKMFCVFLIGSVSDRKGVTSDNVDELLWPGMDKGAAANNRNVNIRKLRLLLSEMKDVQLVYSRDIWTLHLGENVRCDYKDIYELMHGGSFENVTDRNKIERLAALACRGTLLNDMTGEWSDHFKSAYSLAIDRTLMAASRNPLCLSDPLLMLLVTDAMLAQDPIDEVAIKLRCHILCSLGRKSYAREIYENFAYEYKHIMGSDPDFDFADCLKK